MSRAIQNLLRWYRKNKRDLPWRDVVDANGKPDAYKIFVSEIMLQQTQVDRVIPKFETWLHAFPSWKKLAEAKNADVIRAWSGLGYNRRALYARDASRQVVLRGVPHTEDEWRALPGVGPYTAAAIAGFANRKRTIAIDTNVRRVTGRVFCGIPFPQLKDTDHILRVLRTVLPKRGKYWEIPAAFMDLGSSVCRSAAPHCQVCPLRVDCKARQKFERGTQHVPLTKTSERIHRNKKYPDRIYRGRILSLVCKAPCVKRKIGARIDDTYDDENDAEWIERMIARLVRDKLIEDKNEKLFLPRE